MKEEIIIKDNLEKCVICYSITDVKIDTPINSRQHYFEGAGQLCEVCDDKIYNKGKKKLLTYLEIWLKKTFN